VKSALLTKEIVEEAITILRPSIEEFMRKHKYVALAIVVLDPLADPKADEFIVWEGVIGEQDKSKWPDNDRFDYNAREKALISFRTGLPSHAVQRLYPHLYKESDFKYGGSSVFEKIITGSSGFDQNHDLMWSNAVSAVCHGLCMYACDQQLMGENKYITAPKS